LILCNALSVTENYEENAVSIYPNPFSISATLNFDMPLENTSKLIHNLNGQLVKQLNGISGKSIVIFSDNLTNGAYFIFVKQDNTNFTVEKIIINR